MAETAATPTSPQTFIVSYPGALPIDICEDIIDRFEKDSRRHPSRTATRANPLVRSGTMLDIPLYPEWEDVCTLVTRITRQRLDDYVGRYPSLQSLARPENCYITGPALERIDPGQGYGFHIDAGPGGTYNRFLSGLLYLRDVKEGGQTEFPYQSLRVAPTAGTLLFFPPFWTHLHRGMSPVSGTKYNITNFVVIRPPAAAGPAA